MSQALKTYTYPVIVLFLRTEASGQLESVVWFELPP